MFYKLSISTLFIFFFLHNMACFIGAIPSEEITNTGIRRWCTTSPHPDPCNYVMHHLNPNSHHDFRVTTIRAAMDQAVDAAATTLHSDCNGLIEHAIALLNTTLQNTQAHHSPSCTADDVQTWLSSALTNVQLCSDPTRMANVSKMISNSLATNAALLGNSSVLINGNVGGYPRWVTSRDRKLLKVPSGKADAVVSQDGSGGFRSIQEAIEYVVWKRVGSERVVVYVKKGVYEENVLINRTMDNVMLVGDGVKHTVIKGSRSVSSGFSTYSSATVAVDGGGFICRGITFRNTAGPESGQAVALRSASDLSVFYACSFEGYQDTLFVQAQRQFYKSCYIYGTVDIIFGNAAVVLQNCIIYVRKPLVGQGNMITAQGRGDPFQNTGISIQNCRVMPAPDLKPVVGSFKTYLGRPWQQYSRTVIMKSYFDDLIDPQGWATWGDSDFALTTLYYGEYKNFGPGASTKNRVKWPGYHIMTTVNETVPFTTANLITGRQWLPAAGVPFTIGL